MPIQYMAPMQVPMKEDVLERPLNAPADLYDYDFLNTIGGVAFQSIAQPAADFPAGKFSLFYNAKKMDGQRLDVIMGKDTLTASLYDWQLVPLVGVFKQRISVLCFAFWASVHRARLSYRLSQGI